MAFIQILIFIVVGAFTDLEASTIKIDLSKVHSLIKSSKKGFENSYLFIGTVNSLFEVVDDNEIEMVESGKKVEFLFDRSICYDEMLLAFQTDKSFSLKISNVKKLYFKIVDKEDYSAFLKADIHKTDLKTSAGCQFSLF
jgi:hypothetical protein